MGTPPAALRGAPRPGGERQAKLDVLEKLAHVTDNSSATERRRSRTRVERYELAAEKDASAALSRFESAAQAAGALGEFVEALESRLSSAKISRETHPSREDRRGSGARRSAR